ncbi:hypothetical protein [Nocardia huaxiensis]|uniref:DUF4388 domain-containing protein n=1 Tax=Nocardia huaxiensis TaxID=2755382 RepID=A0A7D6Z534_9NOCA|nr:hypothetical protein [Nocardia huaxiensis]QLY33126.1 hypothetical protein H0264_13615 [Nocardia huaxiensis]UFS93104.1 hypothetical protein LPY97_19745 [Nocardia huaxiensis]
MTTGAHIAPAQLLALGRESARELVRELAHASATARTGTLRVTGEPGGDLYVAEGRVLTVESPGAPGIRELLARPGRTCTGMADLRLVAMMAALDGAFAITSGWIGGCHWQDRPSGPPVADSPIPPVPGVDPGWLLLETDRRLRALAHGRVSPHRNHLQLTEAGRLLLSGPDNSQWQPILLWVNGRRSCRDIAMLLCRALYAVTVDVVRMLDCGLLVIGPAEREPDVQPARGGSARSMLPRRRRGASGINDTLPPRPPMATRGMQLLARKSERTQ